MERSEISREDPFAPIGDELSPSDEEQLEVEEWTGGLVRPLPEIERPELEEEPIGVDEQPPLKDPREGEAESKYGI